MTPVPIPLPPLKPARTGLGWLLQACARSQPAPPATDLLFPASVRHPATETFTASLLIGLWSLAAILTLSLHTENLPPSLTLRGLIALLAWLALIHSAVFFPLLTFCLLTPQKLATLTELTFFLLLSLIAVHLTTLPSSIAQALGLVWFGLILAETTLRLVRSGIALASRPR